MIYDQTPQYEHLVHLPYAKEPWKGLYVFQRLLTTLLLVPCWCLYYLVLPRSYRPRPSWNLRQIIYVNFTRRIYRVTEVAGVHFGTRDPDSEPRQSELKETRFEWAPPLDQRLRRGVVVDPHGKVPFKQVGTFVWPKERPVEIMSQKNVEEAAKEDADIPVVGIFMHGGGYCQMSAHEKSRTSNIPRRLMKDKLFSEIYAVEYRLLQHSPIPATVMDAATVYAHVVSQYYSSPPPSQKPTLRSTPNGSNLTLPIFQGLKKRCKIVLIGDSSGGNLVLTMARWLRDEKLLPEPDGLLLFSPSCDASHAFPADPCFYVPRPNASTDYLTDTPEPRALLQRTLLGFKAYGGKWDAWVAKEEPADRMSLFRLGSAGAASVISLTKALARPVRGMLPFEASASSSSLPSLTPADLEHRCAHQDIKDKKKAEENARLMRVVHSEYVSPASPKVLKRWGHPVILYDGGKLCECRGDLDDEHFDCGHEDLHAYRRKLTSQSDPALHAYGAQRESDIGMVRRSPLGRGFATADGYESDAVSITTMTPEATPIPAYHVPAIVQMETLKEEDRSTSLLGEKEQDVADGNKEQTISTPADATVLSSSIDGNTHARKESKASSNGSSITAVTSHQHVPPKITITPFEGETEDYTTPKRHLRTRTGQEQQDTQNLNPYTQYAQRYPQYRTLFEGFPKTLILLGDAERLTIEVENLAKAMSRDLDEEDRKMVTLRLVKDAVHDPFIIPPGWWDEKEKSEVWEDVKGWMKEVKTE
ncbi:hypothetical protein AAF712_009840 [Marasmius tenuissimus]|uniref:Alpha/beta hydrolase fold-3 domain-containing protein n=1 Tax=Marasmius tenuissimus TaxID=585030 RepID=A0ABR2ZPG7_9AGAR